MDTVIYTQTISELTVQLENKEQQLAQAELKVSIITISLWS